MAPRPRGRSRNLGEGQTRVDAALDAMRIYGFPEKLIVTTIKELLNVYGRDGWPFIEEASYKVLLDTILEKVEKEEKEGDASVVAVKVENNTDALAAGPSCLAIACSNAEAMAIAADSNEALDAAPEANKIPDTLLVTNESAEGETSCWIDSNFEPDFGRNHMSIVKGENDGNFDGVERPQTSRCSAIPVVRSPERVDALPTRRRRPYHGWISSDDDEDLVELIPAPLPEELKKLIIPKKQQRRWDKGPGEI